MASTSRALKIGFAVGLIGYASVALFYAIFDFLAARGALYTVNLLGMAVFRGLRDPGVLELPVELDTAAIVWYNLLHLVISLAIGLVVTGLVAFADRRPSNAKMVARIIIAGFFVTIAVVGILTAPIRPVIPWWSIVVANALAVVVAGAYLLRKFPGVWTKNGAPAANAA